MKQRPPPPKEQTNKQTNKQKQKKGEDKKKQEDLSLKKLPYYLKLSASGVKRKQNLDFCDHAH